VKFLLLLRIEICLAIGERVHKSQKLIFKIKKKRKTSKKVVKRLITGSNDQWRGDARLALQGTISNDLRALRLNFPEFYAENVSLKRRWVKLKKRKKEMAKNYQFPIC
jgi:hypothetical protein